MDPPVISLTSTAGFPHGQAIKVSYLEALSPSIDLERALIILRKCVPLACRFSDHSQPVCQSVYLSSYGVIVISSHTLSVALPSINRISNYMQLLLPRAAINGDFSSNSADESGSRCCRYPEWLSPPTTNNSQIHMTRI